MSKNEGEKYISSWHKIMITSFSNSSKLLGSINFLKIAWKNMHRRVITCQTFFGKIPRIETERKSCMRTWQSWDFKPISFKSWIDTTLLIFEEYPCRTLTPCRHPQKLHFWNLDKVWHAGGKYVCLPRGCGCNSKQTPISTRSLRAFIPSFVFTLIFYNMPIILSQTFVSTCITSMKCLTSNFDQYWSSKNMDFFFHVFFHNVFLLCFSKSHIDIADLVVHFLAS